MRSGNLTFSRARRLRRDMTRPEIVLWMYLRNHGLAGMHFRRQHAVGPYILDFYCAAQKLCIELDGITHSTPEGMRHDEARTAWLEAKGIRVVRFAGTDVMNAEGLRGVLLHRVPGESFLTRRCQSSPHHQASPGPPPPLRGRGC